MAGVRAGSVPVETRSLLTCPLCGGQQEADMPLDACQYFWECPQCQGLLRPKPGDCCVFCSYATVPCPPMQMAADGCGGGACT